MSRATPRTTPRSGMAVPGSTVRDPGSRGRGLRLVRQLARDIGAECEPGERRFHGTDGAPDPRDHVAGTTAESVERNPASLRVTTSHDGLYVARPGAAPGTGRECQGTQGKEEPADAGARSFSAWTAHGEEERRQTCQDDGAGEQHRHERPAQGEEPTDPHRVE